MGAREIALAAACVFHVAPAAAFEDNRGDAPNPRAITAFSFGAQKIEMLAITRRARADTPMRRAYMHECEAMAKVLPGYPQPAFVTVDFRVKF